VEAIAVSLTLEGEVDRIFENGFFQALHSRTIDINLEDNPYPGLSAVRALATALKLRYALSPRLARYIITTHAQVGSEAMAAAQESHYGWVRFRKDHIKDMASYLQKQLNANPDEPVMLPQLQQQQLTLWE